MKTEPQDPGLPAIPAKIHGVQHNSALCASHFT